MSQAPGDLHPAPSPGPAGLAEPRPPWRSVARWLLWAGGGVAAVLLVWLVATDSAAYRYVLRLSTDRHFLKQTLRQAGLMGPVIFIGLQALQVVVAPIPGEVTGFLGGFVFGEALGFLYSTVGLTLGSVFAFGLGRWLGAPVVRRLVSRQVWDRMAFLVKPQGAVLCFLIFLIPGFPKDIACFLFGLSPIPFGVYALLMTLGRMPGTWALSAQGARTATGDYRQVVLIAAIVIAVGLPLYYGRHRILAWYQKARSGAEPAPHREERR